MSTASPPHSQALQQWNYVAHKPPRVAMHPGKCSRHRKKIPFQRPALAGMVVRVRSEFRLLCAVARAGVWAIGSKWGWGAGLKRDKGSVGTPAA